ncbi:phage tail assembly chaperone [Shinella pollutisoli]|uniref:phage tail assembly chaperone n=1 Tax=Shinella pollutisoli TaxID=2250594 RepID=UPI003FA353BE
MPGKKPGRVEEMPPRPPCPALLVHVWDWFLEIYGGASGGGMGPPTITWPDVRAWSDLTRERPEPWEARLILRLSGMQARIASERAASPDGSKGRAGKGRTA